MSKIQKELLKQEIEQVDLKFVDFLGRWQHTTIPISAFSEDNFEEGIGFDGSSIRGWMAINESDMQLRADKSTARIDPFGYRKTISYICNVFDPISGQPYGRDPRYITQKAEKYLKSTGIADVAYFGPEAEFYLFDDVRYNLAPNNNSFHVDSDEAGWNSSRKETGEALFGSRHTTSNNIAYKYEKKGGYFPAPPFDRQWNLRGEMVDVLESLNIPVEVHHHEVGGPGQAEIGIKFSDMLDMADRLMWFMYVIRNVAFANDKAATFMPKPIYGEAGSGMHTHVSLWKDGKNLFAGDQYGGLSRTALHFIGGVLHHAQSLIALTNPTTNSYKRLVPGYEAPVNLAYSSRNRSAAIRIPAYAASANSKRIEFRAPDGTCNPYLAFPAILMAGLDGIENAIDPGEPIDKDIYNLQPEELADIPQAPQSLEEALYALEDDYDYLLKGDVFTEDVIQNWIAWKFKNDIEEARLHPTPLEYKLYFNG